MGSEKQNGFSIMSAASSPTLVKFRTSSDTGAANVATGVALDWLESEPGDAFRLPESFGIIAIAYNELFVALIETDDSLVDVMRKFMFFWACLAAPPFLMLGVYWIVVALGSVDQDHFLAVLIAGCVSVVAGVTCIGTYCVVRASRLASDVGLHGFVLAGMLVAVALVITVPKFPVNIGMLALAQCAVLGRSDFMVTHLVLIAVIFFVATYNAIYINASPRYTLLTLPSPYVGPPAENLALSLIAFGVVLMMSRMLYVHYDQYMRLVTASRATTDVGLVLADRLRRWDVPAVERALAARELLSEPPLLAGGQQAVPQAPLQRPANYLGAHFANILSTIRDFAAYVPRDIVSSLAAGASSSGEAKAAVSRPLIGDRDVAVLVLELAHTETICELAVADVALLLGRYHDVVYRIVAAHGGTVISTRAAAVVCVWGAPRRCVGMAARACRAALHVIAEAEATVGRMFDAEGCSLLLRAGVHCGAAPVGVTATADRACFFVHGAVPETATALARLARRVGRSAVVASEAALRMAEAQCGRGAAFVALHIASTRSRASDPPQAAHLLVGSPADVFAAKPATVGGGDDDGAAWAVRPDAPALAKIGISSAGAQHVGRACLAQAAVDSGDFVAAERHLAAALAALRAEPDHALVALLASRGVNVAELQFLHKRCSMERSSPRPVASSVAVVDLADE